MLQVARPLANETIEGTAIALLEANSVEGITSILLEVCLARSEASRGIVFLGTGHSMAPANNRGGSGIAAAGQIKLISRVREASAEGTAAALSGIGSAFEGVASPVTALVLPLRRRSDAVGALYVEYDDCRSNLDLQMIGALSMFGRQAAHAISGLRMSEDLEREADLRRSAEESRKEIYDSMLKHQRIGKMGDFRFNTRTLRSRGSAQCYTIFGYDEGTDVVGYDLWMDKLHPDDRERVHEEMHAAFAKQVPLRFEYRVVVDGEVRHILSEGHPEFDRNGDLLYCGVVVDITEQKAVEDVFATMQSELSTALRLASLGELAGSVVHEVNQPLTAIIANADACRRWLAKEPANVEEAREAADHVSSEARRAAAVVSGLDSLARGARTRFAPLRIQDVVGEVLLLLKSHLERGRVAVQLDLSRDLPEIVGDHLQLQQVVFNLVRNASDAMRSVDGRARALRVSVWTADKEMTVALRDSGEGADPERLERMFAPLQTTKSEGLGFGLSICKRIVTSHRGRIWAERNNDDGLTVSFSIPTDLVPDVRPSDHSETGPPQMPEGDAP
jgi:two-component system, LuxR family, sensor kinase FixL